MTDVTLPRYNELNSLRPANAGFGEVVCIELYFNGESLGYNKRKSIHVPPSSNAYWNFCGLRSLMVERANLIGIQRRQRDALYLLIDQAVRWIHENELKATYSIVGEAIQYYNLHIVSDNENVSGWVTDTGADENQHPLFSVVVS